jgi:hypothetical protein
MPLFLHFLILNIFNIFVHISMMHSNKYFKSDFECDVNVIKFIEASRV